MTVWLSRKNLLSAFLCKVKIRLEIHSEICYYKV